MSNDLSILIFPIGCLLSLICIFVAQQALRKRRLIDDTPTSKTMGVFIGMTELKGSAECEQPVTSFLASDRCVHYAYDISEHWSRTVRESYTDSKGRRKTRTRRESGWKTVDSGGQTIPFYLKDDSGVLRILPHGAKIEAKKIFSESCGRSDPLYYGKGPDFAVSDSDHRRRFVEWAIPLHHPLFIVGRAREREDMAAAEIAHDEEAPLYLISTRSEEDVSSGFGGRHIGFTLLGLVLIMAAWPWMLTVQNKEPLPVHFVSIAVGYFSISVMSWAWMVFNSLIRLRNRVRRAWSQIDVQLKRRADLIPGLINVVKGMSAHEQETQKTIAELRSQIHVTEPGEQGANPQALKQQLFALSESYPEIKSDSSFLKLQTNLIETEERIALARSYYNEIVTFYNTRLEVVPDRFLAQMAGMKPHSLMEANAFERRAVQVDLSS